jgi:MSHA biogenesis protein MshI
LASIGSWFKRARHGGAASAWLAAHTGPESALAARCEPAEDGLPRVQFSPLFSGPSASRDLWQWARQQSGGTDAACIVLRASDYRIVPTERPAVPPEEQRQALRWQIRDMLDFPADEAVVDGLEIPAAAEGQAKQRMFAVAAKNEDIRALMLQCREAKLPLQAIDIPEMALRNLSVLAAGDSAHAFLHIGLRSSRLVMVWQREICAFRQFELSIGALSSAAPLDRSMLLERIALEVQRTADAFVRQFHGAHLQALWLCAAGHSEALVAELNQLLALQAQPYEAGRYLALPSGTGLVNEAEGIDYTLVVGAALRH